MTALEFRKMRLQRDYQEMLDIKGSIIDWRVTKGTVPYVDAYELTVNVRSIINSSPSYQNQHIIAIELPANYPHSPPQTTMITKPQPFHCDWYSCGKWSWGAWDRSESLGHYVIRMIRTLQFDLDITNLT